MFIPTIGFTLFILGQIYFHTVSLEFLECIVPGGTICIETFTLFFSWAVLYFIADVRLALLTTAWMGGLFVLACHVAAAEEDLFAIKVNETIFRVADWALYLHLMAWTAQFYGHGVHEGRAPALLTNIGFAAFAPFFVSFEFCNKLFGYKEGPQMNKIRAAIEKDIREYQQKKVK